MSNLTSKIRSLWKRFSDKEYRSIYLDESINSRLAGQIFSLRTSRNMTQAQVSELTGIAQPTLSRLESDCRGITTTTLKKIAAAYDVALVIKFAPFSEFTREISDVMIDRHIKSFDGDSVAVEPIVFRIQGNEKGKITHLVARDDRSTASYLVSAATRPNARETAYV